MKVPFCDVKTVYEQYRDEFDCAYRRVMKSGHYILGPETRAFEDEFAAWTGIPACVGTANGTDAVELALRGIGVGRGDNVATVSHTAVATVAAIERLGAYPVLVDIDPDRFTMSPASLARVLATWPVKAVVPVHLYGQCADMPAIMDLAATHACLVAEDCAQAHGAALDGRKAGTFGHAAAFSFYPTKNLGAFGDGGAALFQQTESADTARQLRQYGWKDRYISAVSGFNSRLDELQAAFLRVRLRHLEKENDSRRCLAARYLAQLAGIKSVVSPHVAGGSFPVWHLFVIKTAPHARQAIVDALTSAGIAAAIHYPLPVHLQPAYAGRVKMDPQGLPATEEVCRSILSLPMYAAMPESHVDAVCRALHNTVCAGSFGKWN